MSAGARERRGSEAPPVLVVRELTVQVATPNGAKTVIDRIGFELLAGETLCLAGESGCFKNRV